MTHPYGRRAKPCPLTYEQLAELVYYNPDTGEVSTVGPYASKGTVKRDGYVHLRVPTEGMERGERKADYYRADHLAWMLVTGEWPDGWMEHINDVRADNRLDNLVHIGSDNVRWWYGRQAPDEERVLVRVEAEGDRAKTHRVTFGGNAALMPVVVEDDRVVEVEELPEFDPHEEDIDLPKGEFGVDWV